MGEATFYKWKAKYGGLQVSDVQKLKRLEEENAKLKRVVADLTLDNVVLKDLLGKTSSACKQTGRGDSREGLARNVLAASEFAVAAMPNDPGAKESRGLCRIS